MSLAGPAFDAMHGHLFATLGEPATVTRGAAPPVDVRVIITRGVERLGEYGQVVGHVTTADFLLAQWHPKAGDVLAWSDHRGAHAHAVTTEITDDGYVAKVVLHG